MHRYRPSLALVVALLALVVALGGTSYAVSQLPKNSVGTPQLKKGAVTTAKISKATRRALQGRAGPAGPAGARGETGAQGIPGPTFGATVSGSAATSAGCTETTLLSLPLTVVRPSRILGSGAGAFETDGTGLASGQLLVALFRDGVRVAESPVGLGTSFSSSPVRIPISVDAVLGTTADVATAYVATPGAYELRLQGRGSDGSCGVTSIWWRPFLTYVLLGTAP